MKLYMLIERWGSLFESVRAPRGITDEEKEASEAAYEANKASIMMPDAYYIRDGPSLQQVYEMAHYFWWLAVYVHGMLYAGPAAADVIAFVNTQLQIWGEQWLLATALSKAVYFVGIHIAIIVLLYIVNPSESDFVQDFGYPYRYIMRYNGNIWWADIAAVDWEGKGLYARCAQIENVAFLENRNEHVAGMTADRWEFAKTWVQRRSRVGHYYEYRWGTVWAQYIGMLHEDSTNRYVLRRGEEDPWLDPPEIPWVKPLDELCDLEAEVP